MALKLANNAVSRLAASITEIASSVSIQSADIGKFPLLAEGDWHPVTIFDAAGNMEILKVTARNGNVLTVERGQEGTAAKPFSADSGIEIRLTSGIINVISEAAGRFDSANYYTRAQADQTFMTGHTVWLAYYNKEHIDWRFLQYYDKAAVDRGLSEAGRAAESRVHKGGDTMTGTLRIRNTRPAIELLDTDNGKSRHLQSDGDWIGMLGAHGDWNFRVSDEGQFWTRQFGDLHERIETRARDWANDRVANIGARWVGRGDFNNDEHQRYVQGGVLEVPSGAAITGNREWGGATFVYRYFQLHDPARGWVTAHFA